MSVLENHRPLPIGVGGLEEGFLYLIQVDLDLSVTLFPNCATLLLTGVLESILQQHSARRQASDEIT